MASSTAATANDAFCGDRLRSGPSWARTSVSAGPRPPSTRAKDIPTLGGAYIPLLSHSARRVLNGGRQAENKPTQLVGDTKLASDPCITATLEA